MNSAFIKDQSATIAKRLGTGADEAKVASAYQLIFGRAAKPQEIEGSKEFLAKLHGEHRKAGCADDSCGLMSWASYIHGMLASNAFLFVD